MGRFHAVGAYIVSKFAITSHVTMSLLVYMSLLEVTFLGQEIPTCEMLIHVAKLSSRKIVSVYTLP